LNLRTSVKPRLLATWVIVIGALIVLYSGSSVPVTGQTVTTCTLVNDQWSCTTITGGRSYYGQVVCPAGSVPMPDGTCVVTVVQTVTSSTTTTQTYIGSATVMQTQTGLTSVTVSSTSTETLGAGPVICWNCGYGGIPFWLWPFIGGAIVGISLGAGLEVWGPWKHTKGYKQGQASPSGAGQEVWGPWKRGNKSSGQRSLDQPYMTKEGIPIGMEGGGNKLKGYELPPGFEITQKCPPGYHSECVPDIPQGTTPSVPVIEQVTWASGGPTVGESTSDQSSSASGGQAETPTSPLKKKSREAA
jgi:hypothetical protein